jgi:arsenate reductase
MAGAVIYHNPKCSTSRKALELLRDNGIEPEVVQYLKTPPSRAEIAEMIRAAGIDVRTAVRKREALYGRASHPDRAAVRRHVEGDATGSSA